jgi:hypothetical protein
MPAADPIAKHRRYLLEPPDEFVADKLKLFGVSPSLLAKLPPLVVSGRKGVVTIHPLEGAKPKIVDVKQHTRVVQPKSLDQLKELTGVPNRAFEGAKAGVAIPRLEVDPEVLAKLPKTVSFGKLRPEVADDAFAAAHNVVYGPTDPSLLAQPGYAAISKAVVAAAAKLSVFFAPDLVVAAGQIVSFAAFGALYFNNVLVYGNGTIRLGAYTKLHAYQVRHV